MYSLSFQLTGLSVAAAFAVFAHHEWLKLARQRSQSVDNCCRSFNLADANRVLARKAGAIDAVVKALRIHSANPIVSESACSAIYNICFENGAFVYLLLH